MFCNHKVVMSNDPSQTIDISNYGSIQDGKIEIYTNNPITMRSFFGSSEYVNKFRVYAEREGEEFTEERNHTIVREGNDLIEHLDVERQEYSTDLDPRVFESMHPKVSLGGPNRRNQINLDLRDPTVLVPREERVEEDREVFLRSYEGTGYGGDYNHGNNEQADVEASISEGENSTTYVLETGPSVNNKARIRSTDNNEHLNDVLETIEVPELDELLQ